MKQEIIMAGFGGQGVMLMGQVLAGAGMLEGKHVSWLPSYGPEMRGGTANCHVIVSDEPIASPYVAEPDVVIAMNLPSMDKFAPQLKKDGTLIINSSLIEVEPERTDINIVKVPANEIAGEVGSGRAANMVALGAFLGHLELAELDSIISSLKDNLPERHHKFIPLNEEAIKKGMETVRV